MGMYDCINYKMDCPECGTELNSFQSKDRSCTLARLEHWEVDNFYDLCDKCGAWIEFNRKRPRKASLSDYKMTVTRKGEG